MAKLRVFKNAKALQKAVEAGAQCKECGGEMEVVDQERDSALLKYTVVCTKCKRWFDAGDTTVLLNKEPVEVAPFGII